MNDFMALALHALGRFEHFHGQKGGQAADVFGWASIGNGILRTGHILPRFRHVMMIKGPSLPLGRAFFNISLRQKSVLDSGNFSQSV
jgi:hypothetical protein